MPHAELRIAQVRSGAWETASEGDGYYYRSTVGVWIEMLVRNGQGPHTRIGVRWTIDNWNSHHDTLACFTQQVTPAEELWRVEMPHLVTIGWRNGSIGGPDGEQPSGDVWTLWGPDNNSVRCLPLGSHAPDFEFALFLNEDETEYWNNNRGENFKISLWELVQPAARHRQQ
jgi:hypothetical protein